MIVADLGAGTGFFLPYLSRAVGESGRVFAMEVEPALLDYLSDRVTREGLTNVTVRSTPTDAPNLEPASTDLLLIVDVYHHIDARKPYLTKAAEVLTARGRVAIVDWKAGKQPVGPFDEAHKVPEEQVVREMKSAGFEQVATPVALPYQYVLVFSRSKASKPAPP
jgi:ubiquinone/menaquinone biosynthesis C-methylase UbiE